MTNPYRNINELREWLKANSSGVYRPAAHAATVIGEQESELTTLRADNSEIRAKLEAMESQAAPADKPAVAVTDYAKIIRDLAQEFREAWPDDNGKYAWLIGYSDEFKAAPSHSQQSSVADSERLCDSHCTCRDHHPDCPNHEIEKSASPATD